VTGGEREFIGWENFGPAVRLDLARAWALAETFEGFEDKDADEGSESGRADGGEALRATEKKQENRGGIPDPTVAEARGGEHPVANPTRRAPAIQAPHQTMIAAFDETPDVAGYSHFFTSPPKNRR